MVSKIATFNITIGDSFPIWFYCPAPDSCHPNGMVGVINPADGQSIDTQQDAAANAEYQLVPGQSPPAAGSSSESHSASSSVPSAKSKDEKRLSGGAIAGIIIGMLLLAVLVAAGLVFALRRARQRKTARSSEDDSTSLTRHGVEEQIVPVTLDIEPPAPPAPPVHSGLANDPSTPLRRGRSLFQTFYRYPFAEKPMTASSNHAKFKPGAMQDTTIELREEESLIGKATR